ncbi:alpha/beta-hydrolase [Aspergillus ellipticus CBS 707.79]|uniref:Alpha/beta-hydrolase n=1 Tax=Aspergillus ellipticus CBS 707.79 TaxID=1448320 RepID=A0A319CUG3_9EURO|nr:alpha/beta-hydrolase [Aspergillus ellipticus CBS 707.79]
MWMHYSGLVFENRHAVGTRMFHSGPRRGYIVVNLDYRLAPQTKIDEIYEDVEDCAHWVRTTLPLKLGENVVDTSRLILGGGSCGAQLALTAGLYMDPPPRAIISLYALSDPTDPGRTALIPFSEVADYLGPWAPSESHPENGLGIPNTTYRGRASALFFMLQEGMYLPSVYGSPSANEIYSKRAIRENVTAAFPPTFVAHAAQDRFVPVRQSQELVDALERAHVPHVWYNLPGNYDHGFDVWEMSAGGESDLDKEFAAKLWPWLDSLVRADK